MPYGLTDAQLTQIRQVLAREPHLEQAVLFGSRAKGTARPGSDLDLALMGPDLGYPDLLRLGNALDDLDLPFFIDLLLYHQIEDSALREHIDRVGIPLYAAESASA